MSTTSDGGESARRQFGPAAAAYAASRYHAEGPDLAALVEAAELTGTERALDLGCGAGHTALALAPPGPRRRGLRRHRGDAGAGRGAGAGARHGQRLVRRRRRRLAAP